MKRFTGWWGLLQQKRRTHRRRGAPVTSCLAAEVLTPRQLLSGNVNLAVAGNAITLTAGDAGDHGVAIYRLDANHVEIDGAAGTTIGGAATKVLNLSSVSTLTVNLGTGYDTIDIHDLSTTGNINVNGQMAGAAGANVTIQSEHAAVTIGGSIIANLGVQTATASIFYVDSAGQNLTVKGSINVTDAGTAQEDIEFFTGGASLVVNGALSVSENYSGTILGFEGIFTEDVPSIPAANLTVNGAVTLVQSGSGPTYLGIQSSAANQLLSLGSLSITNSATGAKTINIVAFNSNILVKGSFTASLTGGTNRTRFIATGKDANIAVNGSVTVTEADSTECSALVDANIGSLTVGSGLSINQSSPGDMTATISNFSISTLAIKGSVAVNQSGAGNKQAIIATKYTGAFAIGGPVTINQNGSGNMTAQIFTSAGALTVNGVVTISQSGSGTTTDLIEAGVGDLTLSSAMDSLVINDSATGSKSISLFSNAGLLLLKGSFTANVPGGMHGTTVRLTAAGGNVTVQGSVKVTESDSISNQADIDMKGGKVTVGQGVAISQSGTGGGTAAIESLVGTGSITIGPAGVVFSDSGPADHTNIINAFTSSSPIVINGSIRDVSTGQGNDNLDIHSHSKSQSMGSNSPITINGNVSYDNSLNKTGYSSVAIYSYSLLTPAVITITGSLSLKLSSVADNSTVNTVLLGANFTQMKSDPSFVVDGQTTITGSNSFDSIKFDKSWLKGPVTINTMSSGSNGPNVFDYVSINESEFDSTLGITMSGPKSRIDINKTTYLPFPTPTEFKGAVTVNMTGPGDSIHVADMTGFQPVKFDSTFTVNGGMGNSPTGTLYILPGNVTFAFPPKLVNFAHVP